MRILIFLALILCGCARAQIKTPKPSSDPEKIFSRYRVGEGDVKEMPTLFFYHSHTAWIPLFALTADKKFLPIRMEPSMEIIMPQELFVLEGEKARITKLKSARVVLPYGNCGEVDLETDTQPYMIAASKDVWPKTEEQYWTDEELLKLRSLRRDCTLYHHQVMDAPSYSKCEPIGGIEKKTDLNGNGHPEYWTMEYTGTFQVREYVDGYWITLASIQPKLFDEALGYNYLRDKERTRAILKLKEKSRKQCGPWTTK